uniref:Methyltransferase like 25 n=1 Tax=Eptatretus burgeri TaxID=7764 RepID=A0A8C4NMW8_EPTBU
METKAGSLDSSTTKLDRWLHASFAQGTLHTCKFFFANLLLLEIHPAGVSLLRVGISTSSKIQTLAPLLSPAEFMSCKKSHEVELMSEVIAVLAHHCHVRQVFNLGSGKGYLSSYLALCYGLKVYGIDSSDGNSHGAAERHRKLQRFWKSYERKSALQVDGNVVPKLAGCMKCDESRCVTEIDSTLEETFAANSLSPQTEGDHIAEERTDCHGKPHCLDVSFVDHAEIDLDPFLKELPQISFVPKAGKQPLTWKEQRQRREASIKAKAQTTPQPSFHLPVTSHVTPKTKLSQLVGELEDSVLIGLHTCGDLAATSLRLFAKRPELRAICTAGCCYHLLSEEFELIERNDVNEVQGFPLSEFLKSRRCALGRNVRMCACLAAERVATGKVPPTESLFFRAVLQVIIQEHFGVLDSTKHVGKTYARSSSFLDYVRKSLEKLSLDGSQLSDGVIQSYLDKYQPKMVELEAFNMLKVLLAPCIEGLILLDRLCFLQEQEPEAYAVLVPLFDPRTSPRCFALIATKKDCLHIHK